MKMYKKSELTLVNGMIVNKDGDIICPDRRVVYLANDLETMAQKVAYLATQPSATPMPSLDGFERQSIKGGGIEFRAKTPCLDQKIEEAEALMDELDDVKNISKANDMVEEYNLLIQFAKDDYVIDCDDRSVTYCFDTPILGSILELTVEDISDVIADICGLDITDVVKASELETEVED